MDSFESVVATILERDGYWIRSGFKVELTKEEKQRIGRHSSPRWELDLVAYKASANEVLVVECKSYLDSLGVNFNDVTGKGKGAKRYKLFNDRVLREVVFGRLIMQLVQAGACAPDPSVRLCLAAGKIVRESDRTAIQKHFNEQGWQLWDAQWLRAALTRVADGSYDNQVAAVVAKLLLRR